MKVYRISFFFLSLFYDVLKKFLIIIIIRYDVSIRATIWIIHLGEYNRIPGVTVCAEAIVIIQYSKMEKQTADKIAFYNLH